MNYDHNWAIIIIAAIIIGVVITLIVMKILNGKHKTVRFQPSARDYVVDGSLEITNSRDTFLYTKLDKVPLPKNDEHGGPGGPGGHH